MINDCARLIIDRFEGETAVCEGENRKMVEIRRSALPTDAKEGDMFVNKDGVWIVDCVGTEKRREEVRKLMEGLWG